MNDSTRLARSVLRDLVEHGVHEIVLCPGSRNAPLAFAAYDLADGGIVRLHTRIDERTAGFLALGLGRNGSTAAVICTSGTAVANLHPAVLEAAHAAVPLFVVTADRPLRLRGTSANQTTTQPGIFGPDVPCRDLTSQHIFPAESAENDGPVSRSSALRRGPVHLNVQFDEPLLPDDRWSDLPETTARQRTDWRRSGETIEVPHDRRTVVIAGDDAGPPARQLAERAGWPLFAEPSSGSRTGANAIRTYRLLLGGPLQDQIERVIVFGHPTLSRPITRLLNSGVEVWARREPGVSAQRPFATAHEFDVAQADENADHTWLDRWRDADRETGQSFDTLLRDQPDLTPHEAAGAVARALPEGGLLIVGASSPIRDLDLMVPRYRVGARRKVIANRGLAGIDGTVSTAIGAALARESTRTLALMGNVTFLHDATGLVLGPDEPRPDLTLVVINDDGGSIFSMLEQGAPAYADRYDRLFGLPHGVDIASLCAATRTPHLKVTSLPELDQALASPNGGIEVVEVRVRRDNRRELDARIRALG